MAMPLECRSSTTVTKRSSPDHQSCAIEDGCLGQERITFKAQALMPDGKQVFGIQYLLWWLGIGHLNHCPKRKCEVVSGPASARGDGEAHALLNLPNVTAHECYPAIFLPSFLAGFLFTSHLALFTRIMTPFCTCVMLWVCSEHVHRLALAEPRYPVRETGK